jgi:hypothetical protein
VTVAAVLGPVVITLVMQDTGGGECHDHRENGEPTEDRELRAPLCHHRTVSVGS